MRNYYVISILLFFIISYLSIYNKCYWLNRYCFNQRVKSNLFKYSILSQALLQESLNFYSNFVLKYNIQNYYFIALDKISLNFMLEYTNNIFLYEIFLNKSEGIDFGTPNYGKVVIRKTKIDYFLLMLKKNIMLFDLDIFFFKNPINNIIKYREDLVITSDVSNKFFSVNTGL